MYSVVLMAALSTGAGAPDCWHRHSSYATCHGCYAAVGCTGCWGCTGCYGGTWRAGCYGCFGGYGCYGGGCSGCYGCYGFSSYAPVMMPPAQPPGKTPEPLPKPKPDDKDKGSVLENKARLVVEVPADARLYIDDQMMKTESARRVFNTPRLDPAQAYYYVLRAEIVRDGRTFTESKQVIVRAGAEVQASFNSLELAAARGANATTVRR